MPGIEGGKLRTPGLTSILFEPDAGLPVASCFEPVADALVPGVAEIGFVRRDLIAISSPLAERAAAAEDELMAEVAGDERLLCGVGPKDHIAQFRQQLLIGFFAQIVHIDLLQNLFLPIELRRLNAVQK